MKIAGIIAEYNPFHSGHAWHIAETRRVTGCDAVIAVMDGHFTQRGEPACLDKWNRAQMALSCGVDAVFELPALFAMRPANIFAQGGVGILAGLGVDWLSFGCEPDALPLLDELVALSEAEPEDVQAAIRRGLDSGMSHARARGEAYATRLGVAPDRLDRPNAVLALEYRRAISRLGAQIFPVAIPRLGDYYGEGPSATAVRAAIKCGDTERAAAWVPEAAQPMLANACRAHAPDDLLLDHLRSMSPKDIAALPDAPEGIGTRVIRAARSVASVEELIGAIKCKRYTRGRIQRLLAHALLGIDATLARSHPLPEYARLIGMRDDAAPVLRELSHRSRLPIVSGTAQLWNDPVFRLECRATDLWALTRDLPEERKADQEFTRKFVRV